jgi:hypothetical protein
MTGSLEAADGSAMMADLLPSALDLEGDPSEACHLRRQIGCRQEVAAWRQAIALERYECHAYLFYRAHTPSLVEVTRSKHASFAWPSRKK